MKIGILTYHRARNYGAFLQSVALCSRLNMEEYIDAEIIDFDMARAQREYSATLLSLKKIKHLKTYFFNRKLSIAFERGMNQTKSLRSKEILFSDDINEFQKFVKGKYDIIISGSDEVWNVSNFRGFPTPYFLIGDLGCRKFSYAVSARSDFGALNEDNHRLLNKALKEFEFISVRDSITFDQVKREEIDKEKMMISCDPSFLYEFDVKARPVSEIVRNKRIINSKKTVLVLCENNKIHKYIRSELGKEFNLIAAAIRADGYICDPDLDPFEWLELIKSVDFVISSFFHGVCFSIMNNTPFIAVASNKHRGSKLYELLNGSILENHYIDTEKNIKVSWKSLMDEFSKEHNYNEFVKIQRSGFDLFLERLKMKHE